MQEIFNLEKDNRITILMLSWRDIKNPLAGGAEVYTHELLSRVDTKRFRIVHFSPSVKNEKNDEVIDNIRYIRKGNLKSVIFYSSVFYKKNKSNIDIVIDQCNTFRFFTKFWVKKNKRIFFTHQLCRELWDVMLKPPISKIGRIMETPMLKLNKNDYAITVSESVKKEMVDVGFDSDKIIVIPNGYAFEPWSIEQFCEKESNPTFVYVGRCVKSKGIDQLLMAFGSVKKKYQNAKVWIIGNCKKEMLDELIPIMDKYNLTYGEKEEKDIVFKGFVSEEEKKQLQSRALVQVFPSIREGWGRIITEAAMVGTPSIVYNTTGCCDAVDYGNAGWLCENNTVDELVDKMIFSIENHEEYEKMRMKAYEFSKQFDWDTSAKMFEKFIVKILENKQFNHI